MLPKDSGTHDMIGRMYLVYFILWNSSDNWNAFEANNWKANCYVLAALHLLVFCLGKAMLVFNWREDKPAY